MRTYNLSNPNRKTDEATKDDSFEDEVERDFGIAVPSESEDEEANKNPAACAMAISEAAALAVGVVGKKVAPLRGTDEISM